MKVTTYSESNRVTTSDIRSVRIDHEGIQYRVEVEPNGRLSLAVAGPLTIRNITVHPLSRVAVEVTVENVEY